jgi:hypothetical protein
MMTDMHLPLTQLDDRSYADLLEEARALIPAFAPGWTDHNPADPGITLIELFAWLSEMLLYRANHIPDRQRLVFLKLLNGPQWSLPADTSIDAAIRSTVTDLRSRYRTVTSADYVELALTAAGTAVARAHCLPKRNLAVESEDERRRLRPGHISLIVLPLLPLETMLQTPDAEIALLEQVRDELAPRRLLGTHNHIVGPLFAAVGADILLAPRSDWPEEELRRAVVQAIADWLDPYRGAAGTGWPFGRAVYLSELYQRLEQLPGVDYLPDIELSSECPAQSPRCTSVPAIYHPDGDQIGLELAEHQLPWPRIDPARIVIAERFADLRISVQLQPAAAAEPAAIRRAVKTALRRRLHPRTGGPDWANWRDQARALSIDNFETLLLELPQINRDLRPVIELAGDSDVLEYDLEGRRVIGVRLPPGVLAGLQISVDLRTEAEG